RPLCISALRPAAVLLLVALVAGAACRPFGTPPTIEERLHGVGIALGGAPVGSGGRYLRYAVDGDEGRWVDEFVVEGGDYAERRTRSDGRTYTFGRDRRGAWLSTDEHAPVTVDAGWAELARTDQAVMAGQFTRPGPDDEAEYMGRSGLRWDF